MVMRLAAALDMPLRQQNALLLAAGFAPVWQRDRSRGTGTGADRAGRSIYMLAQQEPFPAVVVDRHWNLLKANAGAIRLVEFLVGPLPPGTPVNLADALVAPDVLRPFLVNWAEVVALLHPQRRGRRGCRRHRGDRGVARPAAVRMTGCGSAEGCRAGAVAGPILPDAFPQGRRVSCSSSRRSRRSARRKT